MEKISNLVKILTGRKLSEKKMNLIRSESRVISQNREFYSLSFDGKRFHEKIIKYNPIKKMIKDMYKPTKVYNIRNMIENVYDFKGFLEKRAIFESHPLFGEDYKLVVFNPHGSLEGETVGSKEFYKK